MDAYQAGQQLGTLLFGNRAAGGGTPSLYDAVTGNAPNGGVYYRTLAQGAQAQNAMQEARLNRAKAIAAEATNTSKANLPDAYVKLGAAPDAASALGMLALSATTSNPQQLMALVSMLRAQQAAQSGNDPAMNRNIAVTAGKPLELSATNGGITTANPYTAPVVAPNALGDAAIAAHNAAAANSYAQAARANAGIGADKAANYGIETDADGNMVRVNKLTGDVLPLTQDGQPLSAKGMNPIPSVADLAQYFPAGDSDPSDAKYSQAQWDAWRQEEAKRGVTNYNKMLQDFVAMGAKYVPDVPASSGTGTLGNIVNHIFGGTNEAPTPDVPAHFTTTSAPRPSSLGDAALTAAPLPSNVKIIMAPGTDPGVVAATQAAAKAPNPTQLKQTGDAPVMPTTQAEFDALPSGTLFVNPSDGKTYRKK